MGVRLSKRIPVIKMVLLLRIDNEHRDSVALNKTMVFFLKNTFCVLMDILRDTVHR
jgi:hypothetical protein